MIGLERCQRVVDRVAGAVGDVAEAFQSIAHRAVQDARCRGGIIKAGSFWDGVDPCHQA